MKRDKKIYIGGGMLGLFVLWTVLVCMVDVQPIGPLGSKVGFAGMNAFVHDLTGVHMFLYTLTDWLSLIPLCFVFGFALLGAVQWIQRKHIRNVDRNILVLGGFYLVVMAAFLLFEMLVINYRPVLISGQLEASYPSSTTMLVMCVMPTAMMQLRMRINHRTLRKCMMALLAVFTAFMVVARLISGVHWLSDIIGGALLSSGLVMLYSAVCKVE